MIQFWWRRRCWSEAWRRLIIIRRKAWYLLVAITSFSHPGRQRQTLQWDSALQITVAAVRATTPQPNRAPSVAVIIVAVLMEHVTLSIYVRENWFSTGNVASTRPISTAILRRNQISPKRRYTHNLYDNCNHFRKKNKTMYTLLFDRWRMMWKTAMANLTVITRTPNPAVEVTFTVPAAWRPFTSVRERLCLTGNAASKPALTNARTALPIVKGPVTVTKPIWVPAVVVITFAAVTATNSSRSRAQKRNSLMAKNASMLTNIVAHLKNQVELKMLNLITHILLQLFDNHPLWIKRTLSAAGIMEE